MCQKSENRNQECIRIKRKKSVTGRSTGSPRFGLEPKANTESLANQRASVISEAALSTKQHYLRGGPHEGGSQ